MQLVASQVLQNPVQLGLLCTSLCQCFEFDRTAAGLLLHAPQESGSHTTKLLTSSHSTAGSAQDSANIAEAEGEQHAEERRPEQPEEQQAALSAILLPRMPNGLAHISTQERYEAIAGVARTAGRVASLAGEERPQKPQASLTFRYHVDTAKDLPSFFDKHGPQVWGS